MGRDLAGITCLQVVMAIWRWHLEDGWYIALMWALKMLTGRRRIRLEKQDWLQQSVSACRCMRHAAGTGAGVAEAGLPRSGSAADAWRGGGAPDQGSFWIRLCLRVSSAVIKH